MSSRTLRVCSQIPQMTSDELSRVGSERAFRDTTARFRVIGVTDMKHPTVAHGCCTTRSAMAFWTLMFGSFYGAACYSVRRGPREKIRFVKQAQLVGLTLHEIAPLVKCQNHGGVRRCRQVRDLLRTKLADGNEAPRARIVSDDAVRIPRPMRTHTVGRRHVNRSRDAVPGH